MAVLPGIVRLRPVVFLLLAAATRAGRAAGAGDPPVVAVTGGSIRGAALGDAPGAVFKGIPFAAPPLGELRWREPMPVVSWPGVRDAVVSGPPAMQPAAGWNDRMAAAGSEDCLYLDVWTPDRDPPAPAAVMVWFHGGGNVAGSGGFDPLYDGRPLVRHGVVLVVVEYRLGVFGFLSLPGLTRESPHHASGNYGILDQVAALQWVHDNIAAFGGDAGNVTIFGQSAGATDVVALMATPLSAGLFTHAISESGSLAPQATQTQADAERAGTAAAALAVPGASRPLAALRALPAAAILKLKFGRAFTTDGWVFPVSPLEAWRSHREAPVPLLIGSNAVEFAASGLTPEVPTFLRGMFGALAPRARALYRLGATPPPVDPIYGTPADQLGSDFFRCVSVVYGEWHTQAGAACWQYQFDRAIPPHAQVAHSGDLPYVFGHLSKTSPIPGDYDATDRKLSAEIETYWTNFAKTGNPNGPGVPLWAPYGHSGRHYLDFTAAGDTVAADNERAPFRELFRALMEQPVPPPAD
jgi:para-nitrobenzyl esterase